MTLAHPTGDHFICVQLAKAARALYPGGTGDFATVGVGTSGYAFSKRIEVDSIRQNVVTKSYSRDRQQRQLECDVITSQRPVRMIDDVAVSGRTLEVAGASVLGNVAMVSLAMLFDSKKTLSLIGDMPIEAAIKYKSLGGGRVPINSISSLLDYPERKKDLCSRYFPDAEFSLTDILESIVGDK